MLRTPPGAWYLWHEHQHKCRFAVGLAAAYERPSANAGMQTEHRCLVVGSVEVSGEETAIPCAISACTLLCGRALLRKLLCRQHAVVYGSDVNCPTRPQKSTASSTPPRIMPQRGQTHFTNFQRIGSVMTPFAVPGVRCISSRADSGRLAGFVVEWALSESSTSRNNACTISTVPLVWWNGRVPNTEFV